MPDSIAALLQALTKRKAPNIASLLRIISTGVDQPGLTGLDPKYIKDPRFDYEMKMGMNPEEVKGASVVLMGNQGLDDYDSAPVGVKSTLAVDQPLKKTIADMENKSTGPSPWFTKNRNEIVGSSEKVTETMAREMVRRMLLQRNRIEDRF